MNKRITLANQEIAVIALDNLGGGSKRVHTEDIARECYRLAPAQFSWRKYPDLPDCDTARVGLSDAHKQKNGALVSITGPSQREGLWMLTAAGIAWLCGNEDRLRNALGAKVLAASTHRDARQYARRPLHHVIRHPAFAQFKSESSCSNLDEAAFVDSLNCTLIESRVIGYIHRCNHGIS